MDNVFSIFNYQKTSTQLYPFIVFATEDVSVLTALTPEVMSLGDGIYIADLSLMESYFKNVAKRVETEPSLVIEKILSRDIGCSLSVACHHPLEGLIFMKHFDSLGVNGHFQSGSLFSQKTFLNINFESWLSAAILVERMCDREKLFISERKQFQNNLTRFKKLILKLNIRTFGELKSVQFYDIQKRYKAFFGLLWKWTFPPLETQTVEGLDLFNQDNYSLLRGFPWVKVQIEESVKLYHHLEFPISTWEQIKPHLTEDLEKISDNPLLRSPKKIFEFNWTVTLYDMSAYSIDVSFKYPICIHYEKNSMFRSALEQFRFGFERFEALLKEKGEDLQYVNSQLIIGWTTEVSKVISPSRTTLDLFSVFTQEGDFLDKVLDLENKIKGEIKVYQAQPNHVFGMDFIEKNVNEVYEENNEPASYRGLCPLYIFPSPIEMESPSFRYRRFLERSSNNWWDNGDSSDSFRDYYMCEDDTGQFIWAYKNYENRWFKHGIFS